MQGNSARTRPSDFEFDSSDRALVDDPYPFYTRLRDAGPVVPVTVNGYRLLAIARYADVQAALRDTRFSREAISVDDHRSLYRRLICVHSMMERDPPEHSRLREGASAPFLKGSVQALEPRLDETIRHALDGIAARDTIDVESDLARPAALAMLSAFLDMPVHRIRAVAEDTDDPRPVVRLRALINLSIATRRERGRLGDDVLGRLLLARRRGVYACDDEVVGTLLLILRAGQHTTAKTIASGLALLATRSDQYRSLRARPDDAATAVEEILRYESPVQTTYRWAREDMDVAGLTVPAGTGFWILIGSANRDPERFSEPSRFRVARCPNRHLAMGSGHHLCLGAPVARLFLQRFFTQFVERFASISLSSPGPVRWRQDDVFRGTRRYGLRLARRRRT